MVIIKCQICGKEIKTERKSRKYCSKICENKARQKRKNNKINALNKKCIICGEDFVIIDKNANNRKYCYNCVPLGVTASRTVYVQLIKKKYGNQCKICGYNKCSSALEFHHLNENTKEGVVSNSYGTVEESLKEAEKCILVCANCHREIHAGLIVLGESEVTQ